MRIKCKGVPSKIQYDKFLQFIQIGANIVGMFEYGSNSKSLYGRLRFSGILGLSRLSTKTHFPNWEKL